MQATNYTRAHRGAPLRAIIIGTGFGGLGMAIALKKRGIDDFVMLERAGDVGGVWRDNSYPGAACDVPSHLYSFSFEPNPNWSHTFARQDEIHEYLRHCARKYKLLPHVQFNAEVAGADFDEDRQLWVVHLKSGGRLEAQLLVSATGQLSLPSIPKLQGLDDFRGHSFHSAKWDHSFALDGKRVAVVGTGASATQFVPAIIERVAKLSLFQRSPSHIIPRNDREIGEWGKSVYRAMPWLMKLRRVGIYTRYESRALAFTRFSGLLRLGIGTAFLKMLKQQISDPAMRAKLTPEYAYGCKRILTSDNYLPALVHRNIDVVTQGIRRITATGIETTDGQHHQVDAIIYGTGFAATSFLSPMVLRGRKGLELNKAWGTGAKAYLGMTVPAFPNLFMLYGPNTNLGHNSIVYMLESQIAHVMRIVKAMEAKKVKSVEVNSEVYEGFNQHLKKRLTHTVWNGCSSWYVDSMGNSSTNWPGFTLTYRRLARKSSLNAYRFGADTAQKVAL